MGNEIEAKDILKQPVDGWFRCNGEEWGLKVRVINCLKDMNIKTIEDLLRWPAKDLLLTPNLGKKSLTEIQDILNLFGLKLPLKRPGRTMREIREKEAPPTIKENIIYQDKIVYKEIFEDKIIYKDKIVEVPIEKEIPTLSKCIICQKYPTLTLQNSSQVAINEKNFQIKCFNCGTFTYVVAPQSSYESLFPCLYQAIHKWNKMGAHLEVKIEETKNAENS